MIGSRWCSDSSYFSDHRCLTDLRAARDLVSVGGKRWRPLLMLLTAKMLGDSKRSRSQGPDTLVELPHNGT